jgi:hypothetical protein
MSSQSPCATSSRSRWERRLLAGAVFLGVVLRYLAAARGHNFDFESFRIVTEIASRGGNVYAETSRYNYGPVWFNLLHLFDRMGSVLSNRPCAFRLLLVTFLTGVDLCIFSLLFRSFGRRAALMFLLNPIGIVITGYHNQFDNLAVLTGLVAVLIYEKRLMPKCRDPLWPSLAVLGVSLVIKHDLFAFPLWMALKCTSWRRAIATAAVPIGIFFASFVPYWSTSRDGIIAHVFLYPSFDNAPLWHIVVPGALQAIITPKVLFALALIVGGWLFRGLPATHSLLLYTLVLVSFSPAVANQYLAIVVPAVAVYWNVPFGLYSLLGSLLVAGNADGLHFDALAALLPKSNVRAYDAPMLTLLLGLIWTQVKLSSFRFGRASA